MTQKMKLQVDKSSWIPVKFGEIVREVRDTVRQDEKESFDRLIGLEHIDSEDVHIRRWGSVKKGTTFTRIFRPRQMLFGRRRAYLKKAGLATFTGLCSGDIIVMEAKEQLIPELLPFLINNDRFFDFAVDSSAGSLSPRTKFKHLAEFEFLLPPRDQQAKIAELLWALDEMIERYIVLARDADIAFKAYAQIISDNHKFNTKDYLSIKDVTLVKDNLRKPLNAKQRSKIKGKIPYYGANGIVDYVNDYIYDEDLVLLAEDGGNFGNYINEPIAYKISGKSWVNNHAHVLSAVTEKVSTDWLFYSLVHKNILRYIIGTTRVKLNKSDLLSISIWCPKKSVQHQLLSNIKSIELIREKSYDTINSAKSLQRLIFRELL